ncbi:MAG TPA: glycogen synthase GlgA [Polyangia bacterium]|nr:glycogen synthase GlgA [Polyangia bacterium]
MKILHVASEVAPFSKTGGLADVLGALPGALAKLGLDVTVVTPRYGSIDPDRFALARWLSPLPVALGADTVEVGVYEGRPPGGAKVRLLLIDHAPSFARRGLYGDPQTGDYPDNARRFALLGRAALGLCAQLGWKPDVVHGHDWQCGTLLLDATSSSLAPRKVFTVHNLAYQGLFPQSVIDELALPRDGFHPEGYEFYGQVSLLKAGLASADRITTVSPRYAEEIQTPEQGFGLDGFLRARADRLTGILNGVDYDVWNPERDPHLPARYSAERLDGKRACKAALQREFGLPVKPETPLFGSISRLTDQKGFDLVAAALPQLLELDLQFVALGTGDAAIQAALLDLQKRHPKKVAVKIAYDERLAHRIEAGADVFVMPSKFEPCGLNQLYSLRYGTPPIVRATGGLDDSIVDYEPRSQTGTGFKFVPYTAQALLDAWRRALLAYREAPRDFARLQHRAMAQDFSWDASARRYAELYARLG